MLGRWCERLAALAMAARRRAVLLAGLMALAAVALAALLPRPSDFEHALPPAHPAVQAADARRMAPLFELHIVSAAPERRAAAEAAFEAALARHAAVLVAARAAPGPTPPAPDATALARRVDALAPLLGLGEGAPPDAVAAAVAALPAEADLGPVRVALFELFERLLRDGKQVSPDEVATGLRGAVDLPGIIRNPDASSALRPTPSARLWLRAAGDGRAAVRDVAAALAAEGVQVEVGEPPDEAVRAGRAAPPWGAWLAAVLAGLAVAALGGWRAGLGAAVVALAASSIPLALLALAGLPLDAGAAMALTLVVAGAGAVHVLLAGRLRARRPAGGLQGALREALRTAVLPAWSAALVLTAAAFGEGAGATMAAARVLAGGAASWMLVWAILAPGALALAPPPDRTLDVLSRRRAPAPRHAAGIAAAVAASAALMLVRAPAWPEDNPKTASLRAVVVPATEVGARAAALRAAGAVVVTAEDPPPSRPSEVGLAALRTALGRMPHAGARPIRGEGLEATFAALAEREDELGRAAARVLSALASVPAGARETRLYYVEGVLQRGLAALRDDVERLRIWAGTPADVAPPAERVAFHRLPDDRAIIVVPPHSGGDTAGATAGTVERAALAPAGPRATPRRLVAWGLALAAVAFGSVLSAGRRALALLAPPALAAACVLGVAGLAGRPETAFAPLLAAAAAALALLPAATLARARRHDEAPRLQPLLATGLLVAGALAAAVTFAPWSALLAPALALAAALAVAAALAAAV